MLKLQMYPIPIRRINVIKSQATYFVKRKSETPANVHVSSFPFPLSPTSGEASLRRTWVDERLNPREREFGLIANFGGDHLAS